MDSVTRHREAVLDLPAPSASWTLERGATVVHGEQPATRFSVWAPRARRVEVVITSGAARGRYALAGDGSGTFTGTVRGADAGTDYAYSLDGGPARPDPVSRWQPNGVHGPSRVVDPDALAWTDGGWTGIAMADYVLYELHVGAFTEAGTFDAAIEHLPALAQLGVTAIALMPVAQFPGSRNWGYDGVLPYAPQNSYGGPAGLARLVDAAHAQGLAVVLDVVYNHLGPEGNYLGEFGPYFTDAYRTPWGPAINYDGPDSDEVRRYVIDNALYWVTEYHVDGLRLDAVHAIYDFGAQHILAELARRVHAQAARLGRSVQVIAESDLNDPRLLRAPARGGYGLDAQWSDDFHHAVHVALTGGTERGGYYAGYDGVPHIAKALTDRFVYDGAYAVHRRRRHGAPALDVPTDRFVICVQNHDQVGNRAAGERLTVLVPPAKVELAAALLLLAPYVPLIFMGEEYGETHPFLYFVSHGDPTLAAAVREGRRREFASFGWTDAVPDPQAEETFLRSKLDRSALETLEARQRLALYHDLLAIRREEPALRPGCAAVSAWYGGGAGGVGDGWLALALEPPTGAVLLALFNFEPQVQEILVPLDGPARGHWRLRFSTRNSRYGGPSDAPRAARRRTPGTLSVALPPESAALYRHEER